LISAKTKAVLPVHMLGVAARMKQIMAVASECGLPVVEDSCEAIGATYDGKPLGTLGDVGVLSFDQGKMIATGEGGMVLTNDSRTNKYVREYHDHGHENNPIFPRGRDTHSIYGFNYRMTEMQAAVGKVQLSKLDRMLEANRVRYNALKSEISGKYMLRTVPENSVSSYDTLILIEEDSRIRQSMIDLLGNEGFGTKNLPDAMEWHCAGFWDHALNREQINRCQKTLKLLKPYVAIPIWLKKSAEDYQELGLAMKRL